MARYDFVDFLEACAETEAREKRGEDTTWEKEIVDALLKDHTQPQNQ